MITVKSLSKDTFFYFLSKLVQGLLSLLFVFLFTKIIGLSTYGKYSFLFAKFNLIVSFAFGWLNQSELRYGNNKLLNNRGISLLPLMISFFLIIPFQLILSSRVEISHLEFLIYTTCIFAIGFSTYIKSILQTNLYPKKVLFLTILQSLLIIALPVLFFFKKINIDSKSILITTSLSFFLSAFIIVLLNQNEFIRYKNQKNLNQMSYIFKRLRFGIPVSIWASIGLSLPFIEKYYINSSLGLEALGSYSAIQELTVKAFSFLILPFTMAVHPLVTKLWNKNEKAKTIQIINLLIKYILIFLFFISFLIIFFNEWIFKILIYLIPSISIQLKSILLPLILTGVVWQLSLVAHKIIELNEETYLMIVFILLSLIITFVGNYLFLPKYGLIASAYTSLLSSTSYLFLNIFYFYKKRKLLL